MRTPSLPDLRSTLDIERVVEFEFVRATENAALQAVHWLGRGEKERADAAACAAIAGVFDLLDVCGEVVIGEGIKDEAPGIFVGERLGTWKPGSPRFDIALDPVDGTSNLAKGLPNSISVIAAAQVPLGMKMVMRHLPSFYSHKVAYGPAVKLAMDRTGVLPFLSMPVGGVLEFVATALGKRVQDLVVVTMDRSRHSELVADIRRAGAALRMISDGDVTAAVAPSLPASGVDLYIGIGGTPEGILAAAAIKCLGGDMQMAMWFGTDDERERAAIALSPAALLCHYRVDDLIQGDSALFCATGISDSSLVPGVKITGHQAETHSILMRARSGTVRRIHATHDLDRKLIPLRDSFLPELNT
jgi:fructose-1,6-bisphosphatase II